MSRIHSRDTRPELLVRSMLHRAGYRFSLRRKDLPGRPDIVLPKYRTVIFVNGCFWHQHKGCKEASRPKTRRKFWADKLDGNVRRDQRNYRALRKLGWRVVMVWECELERKPGRVLARVGRIAGLVPFDSTHRPVNVHRQAAAQNMATFQEG